MRAAAAGGLDYRGVMMRPEDHWISFGRDICGDINNAERREWLVTNGLGGFASGTIAGALTRRYHGLLLAALKPPGGRTLLVSKFDETALYAGAEYPLYTNHWPEAVEEPSGYRYIERFYLDGTTPVWEYALGDAILEKRIWMQPGENTTYVRYRLLRALSSVTLKAKAFVNYRSMHAETRAGDWRMEIDPVPHGLKVTAFEGTVPIYLLSERAGATPDHSWHHDFYLMREADRGLPELDDNLLAGVFDTVLEEGGSCTLIASVEPGPELDGGAALQQRLGYERALLERAGDFSVGKPPLQQLVLAADQFVVKRESPDDPEGRTVIAGYPWFSDWGRDTMIALPGLTLPTGRPEVAATILSTYARYVSAGMLPNRFPEGGDDPEYNTVDAALWYFEALRAHHAAAGDDDLVRQLFPTLAEIVQRYHDGTRYRIQVDPTDGLLYAGEPGRQLTWMDARVGDWVVTPRVGKAVEINALWYNALMVMADFARRLEIDDAEFLARAEATRLGFARFWNGSIGYCYDVLDTPDGGDPRLRPNQLLAVSLAYSPLPGNQQKAIVDVCAAALLTSHGLRSLAPDDPGYAGRYGGGSRQRDGAYHQGTVWSWLIGPFVQAHWRVYRDPEQARSFLWPLFDQLRDHGLGSLSEIFDGNPPFAPRGSIAQAWSIGELLRVWEFLEGNG